MNYNLTLSPLSDDDQPLQDEKGQPVNYKKLLLRVVATGADELKGEEKMERYDIYSKLKRANGTIDLTSSEVGILIEAALAYPMIVAGQVRDFLSPKELT